MSGHFERFVDWLVNKSNTEWKPTQSEGDSTDIDQLFELHKKHVEEQRQIQKVNDILERFQVIERLAAIQISAWDRVGEITPISNGFLLSHKHPLAVRLYSAQSNLLSGQPVIDIEQQPADVWFVGGGRGERLLEEFLNDGKDYMADINLFRQAAYYRRPCYITEGAINSSLAISVRQHNPEAPHLAHGRTRDLCLAVFMPNYLPGENMPGGRDCFNAIGCVNPNGYVENLDELLKKHINLIAGNRRPQDWEAGERLLIEQIKKRDAGVVAPPNKDLPDLRKQFGIRPGVLFVAYYAHVFGTRVFTRKPISDEQSIRDIIDENTLKYIDERGKSKKRKTAN